MIRSERVRSAPLWAIGEPGRAAVELPPGRPAAPAGVADVELTSTSLGSIAAVAASVRGVLHRSLDEPRQDAYALSSRTESEGEEALIAVVCDGVGSLGRSHEAAQLVSRTLVTHAAAGCDWPEAFARANDELRALIETTAGDTDTDADGMATTAVALTVRRDGDDWVGDVAWVGDSSCLHLQPDGRWCALAPTVVDDEDDAGYYTGSVQPLPSGDGACESTTFRLESGALFLMSDGVANPLKWSSEVRDTLSQWWRSPPEPLTFAGQVGFARKTHTDDRTTVGIWQCPGAEDENEDPQV